MGAKSFPLAAALGARRLAINTTAQTQLNAITRSLRMVSFICCSDVQRTQYDSSTTHSGRIDMTKVVPGPLLINQSPFLIPNREQSFARNTTTVLPLRQ